MSPVKKQTNSGGNGERGSVTIMTAISMVFLFLLVGLCIDVSRIYMVRAELQNAADAAALTAARELNGGPGGIDDAITRANAIVNTRGFEKVGVDIASVQFSTTLYGTYMDADDAKDAGTVEDIAYVQVTTQAATTSILFAVKALGTSHSESRVAVAGRSVPINVICDFFPTAVALDPAYNEEDGDDPETGYPAPNTHMTLTFTQGNGNSMTLANKDYILVDVPEISGNGAKETIRLAGGVTSICQTLNVNIPFHATPSSNQNNGPRHITDGVNTRFNIYANGPGQLNATDFPPDSDVGEGTITYAEYDDKTALTAPSPNGPGEDDRRILIVPIVNPGTHTGNPVSAKTQKFGAFFLRHRARVDNPCSRTGGCARLDVEWIDETLVLGSGMVTACSTSTLTLAVLYR